MRERQRHFEYQRNALNILSHVNLYRINVNVESRQSPTSYATQY